MTEHDFVRRFLFEDLGIRGEWVHISDSWRQAAQHQPGSLVARQQLAQALAAVAMLSATIKFNGSMILQVQGVGSLRTLVAQATHDLTIRGLVKCNENVRPGPLATMFGEGRIVLTIEPEEGEPYQGIVPLQGDSLAIALQTYFEQSEQLPTRLWLFADETNAAGLLLQELPSRHYDKSGWERLLSLANTVTEKEMLELDSAQLLYRLFNEEKVRLFDSEPVHFGCLCSRSKLEQALHAFSKQELEDMIQEKGSIEAACEFCNKQYRFGSHDIELLFTGADSSIATDWLH